MADYTPLEEIPKILSTLRATFRSGKTRSLEWRRSQLLQLARFAQDNAEEIAEVLRLDMGKPKQEVLMAEVGAVVGRSLLCAEKLSEWTAVEPVDVPDWQKPWNPRVEKRPQGVALIIAPWNYPLILTMQPLYGAISAGCCAVIKSSEISPNFSSFLAQNLNKYLDPSAYRVILGDVPVISKALELKWDHICYTGNGRVARIISAAAAKHLTPVTLELGGKSPVLVDSTADIVVSAKRILWGKINNAGQVCVAPDYVLADASVVAPLVEALKTALDAFYPNGALSGSSQGSFARIVSDAHAERLKGLLERTKGTIVTGGKWGIIDGKHGLEPTVVTGVQAGDALLEEELFGPILPIVSVQNLDEAIEFVNDRDTPLVLYHFTTSEENKKKVIDNTESGGAVINDTFQQLSVDTLPFGGVGESGHGRQVCKYSFESFVYQRGIVDVPLAAEPFFSVRYPPYTAESLAFMTAPCKVDIPKE